MSRRGMENRPTDAEIVSLYSKEGMTMKDVAELLNVSAGYIHKRLHYCGATIKQKPNINLFITPDSRRNSGLKRRGRRVGKETKRKISEAHKIHCEGHKKQRGDGYVYVYFPDHPCSTKDGYVMEHHLVMEKALGRHIEPGEVVHHINRIRNDNRIENLMLMTFREHAAFHMRERQRKKKGVKTY